MVTRRVSEAEAATDSALANASGFHLRSTENGVRQSITRNCLLNTSGKALAAGWLRVLPAASALPLSPI